MSNMRFNLITRVRAESAVPLQDCSGRNYKTEEREDIIRYIIWGAEVQRNTDQEEYKKHNNVKMDKANKLFLFGSIGVLANLVFYIVFDFVQWYFWDAWLYEGGAYPDFLYNYADLIARTNFILFFVFLGFNAGVVLSWVVREEDK